MRKALNLVMSAFVLFGLVFIGVVAFRLGTKPSRPAVQQLANGDTTDTIYAQCKQRADDGWSQHHVAVTIATYVESNNFTTADKNAALDACAHGFSAG